MTHGGAVAAVEGTGEARRLRGSSSVPVRRGPRSAPEASLPMRGARRAPSSPDGLRSASARMWHEPTCRRPKKKSCARSGRSATPSGIDAPHAPARCSPAPSPRSWLCRRPSSSPRRTALWQRRTPRYPRRGGAPSGHVTRRSRHRRGTGVRRALAHPDRSARSSPLRRTSPRRSVDVGVRQACRYVRGALPLKDDPAGVAWEAILGPGKPQPRLRRPHRASGDPGERTGKAVKILAAGSSVVRSRRRDPRRPERSAERARPSSIRRPSTPRT